MKKIAAILIFMTSSICAEQQKSIVLFYKKIDRDSGTVSGWFLKEDSFKKLVKSEIRINFHDLTNFVNEHLSKRKTINIYGFNEEVDSWLLRRLIVEPINPKRLRGQTEVSVIGSIATYVFRYEFYAINSKGDSLGLVTVVILPDKKIIPLQTLPIVPDEKN